MKWLDDEGNVWKYREADQFTRGARPKLVLCGRPPGSTAETIDLPHALPLDMRVRTEDRREAPRGESDRREVRTVCAWCSSHGRPAAVLVDVPLDDRGLSHGICPACKEGWLK